MNKYDAAQTMNAGTSSKLSMDHQSSAGMENSVKAGSDIQQYEKKGLSHQGTTFMRNQDGELLRMTGNFEQTAGGWKFNGNVQNLSTGETYTGNMSGMAKNMNSMQQGLNIDDISMTGKERANLGDVKGENVAFIQGTVVDSKLSASDVKNKDKIETENTKYENMDTVNVGNSGSMSGDNIMVNGESVSGKVSWNGDTATIEGTKNGMKYSATVENASISFGKNGMSVTGDIVKSNSEGGDSTNINTSYTEDDSTKITSGTKVDIGDETKGYTGGLAMLKGGLSNFGANQGLMKEAFVDNMTKYQNSIMSEQGKNQLSLDKAFGIAGDASGSAGFKILGTGVQASVSAELSAIAKEGSGQVSSADLNRVMNSAILEQLDIDAKNNNWTAEQYDQAARERFGAYNNYLKEQAGQSFGPSDEDLAPIKKAEELGQKTEQVVNKLLK